MKKLLIIFTVIALFAFVAPAMAANPFMDVPAGHWAYDAVAQLASRGVASGYPDGAYKGAQPTTRYEMASMVARVLANVDMEKASKQDVELLKKLVLEFKYELDAMGVKLNELDKRVAVLEDGIGGWKLRGVFYFDAKFADIDKNGAAISATDRKETQFSKERFRLFLTKTIDENSHFYAQYRVGGNKADGMGDVDGGYWSHLYVDTKVFGDWGLRIGRFTVDFEDDHGLYTDNDAIFGGFRTDGFRLSKSIGMLNATAVVGRNSDLDDNIIHTVIKDPDDKPLVYDDKNAHMVYALDLNFRPNEKVFLGATEYWVLEDSSYLEGDWDISTYSLYAGYNFTPNIALKGVYYTQNLGDNVKGADVEDSPKAWSAMLDIKQEALKFTSLWVEYSHEDNTFYGNSGRYGIGGGNASICRNQPTNNGTTKYLFATAKQQWNDKFSTIVRYAHANFDTDGIADATEWGVGVGYQYTSAIYFELMYDQVDYGISTAATDLSNKESIVRFRTTVSF